VPEIQPPELAALLDFAERPRAGGWSLRAALTRYAQGQPRRVSEVLELVRRIQSALGPEVPDDGLLDAAREIDEVGDALAVWATDPWHAARPDAAVDAVIASVTEALDRLGVAREERPGRPPRTTKRRGSPAV
jgi:hypothetical protein